MKLSNQQIIEILKQYDLGEFRNKKLIYNAWNTSYKVFTTRGIWLVKHLNFHSKKMIDRELRVLQSFDKRLPILFPVIAENGKPYITYRKKYILVFKFMNACPVLVGELLSKEALEDLGFYYALIHKTKAKPIHTGDLYKKLERFFSKIPKSSKEYILAQKTFLLFRKNGFDKAKLPSGFIHTDLHTENLLVRKGKIVSVLDFEESHKGPFIYDLGYTILDTCWTGNNLSDSRVKTFLKGYEKVRKLNALERRFIIDSAFLAGLYILHFSIRVNGIGSKKNLSHYVTKRFIKLLIKIF